MQHYEPSAELAELVVALLDDDLNNQQMQRLSDILQGDEAARSYYYQMLQLHACITWEKHRPDQQQLQAQSVLQESSPEDAPAPAPLRPSLKSSLSDAKHASRLGKIYYFFTQPTALSMTVATLVVGLIIGAMAMMAPPFYRAIGRMDDSDLPKPSTLVAHVTGLHKARWPAVENQVFRDAELMSGETLEIASGLVKVRFVDGARATIEGPASLVLESSLSAELRRGVVTVRLSGDSGPFIVRTKNADIHDLGTEFGVAVSASGDGSVTVFDGSVEVRSPRGEFKPLPLVAGQTAQFGPQVDGEDVVSRVDTALHNYVLDWPQDKELLGRWTFDKWDAGKFADVRGTMFAARSSPPDYEPTVISGNFDDALQCDGRKRGLEIANVLPRDFTISLWIKTGADSPDADEAYKGAALLFADVPNDANDFVLSVLNDRLSFHDGAASQERGQKSVNGATRLNDDQWHHVVIARQGGDKIAGIKLFVDGALDAESPAGSARLGECPVISVGFAPDSKEGDGKNFAGAIDDLSIYGRALSEEEVVLLFQRGPEALTSQGP